MWQELIRQVGMLWIIFVFVVSAGLIVLSAVLYRVQKQLVKEINVKLSNLKQYAGSLEGFRIENLELVKNQAGELMNPEFCERMIRLCVDSNRMFAGVWSPDPRTRLVLPDILPEKVRAALRRTAGTAVVLGGIAASMLAFSTGYAASPTFMLISSIFRLLSFLPLVAGTLAMLLLFYMNDLHYQSIRQEWQSLIIEFESRIPVYSQAAETAVIINKMKEYDARMSESAQILADQVQILASGKMAEAVSGAVKYVMAATVAPAVIRSSEALSSLAQEIEKQQKTVDNAVVRLYSDMEVRQQKQADLWHKRYQEISDTLADQQSIFLKDLSSGQQQLVDDLGRSQTFALERIVDEQKSTLQHMNAVSQKSWTILQEKLTLIINQLAEGQQRLLTNLTDQQQSTLTVISSASSKTSESLQMQFQTAMEQLQNIQTEMWQKQSDNQKQAYDVLVLSQKESFTALTEQQQTIHQKTEKMQQESLLQMQTSQSEALQQLSHSQVEALQSISSHQAEALQTISSQQAIALQEMNTIQNQTLSSIVKTQDNTLNSMIQRIQDTLQLISDRFSGEVAGTLAGYLGPVTERLQIAADSLIAAQEYARDVKDVLKLQSDAASTLQTSIGDLFAQLLDTRKSMTEDLQSMKTSSRVMSQAAEAMSSVYAGSQSGLSEAISQMSHDLMHLSEVLNTVMSTSAEQTRLIQSQSAEIYGVNQKHLDAVRNQINILSDELSTRIEQLMIGFTRLTEELVQNIDKTVNTQNDTLGSSLTSLTEIMGNEARSMSLFAQQINMDIESLNDNLHSAVKDFDSGVRQELTTVLTQFDHEVTDVVKRLARAAIELSDSVEALPAAIRQAHAINSPTAPGAPAP